MSSRVCVRCHVRGSGVVCVPGVAWRGMAWHGACMVHVIGCKVQMWCVRGACVVRARVSWIDFGVHGVQWVGLLAAHKPIVGAEARAGTDRADSEGAEKAREEIASASIDGRACVSA